MSVKKSGLNGLNTLSYLGVEAAAPPNFTSNTRIPTTEDYISFNVGHIWLQRGVPRSVWMLIRIYGNVGTWVKFGTPYFSVLNFITDAGTATQVASTINVSGDTIIDTEGDNNTIHINLSSLGVSGDGNVLIGGGIAADWAPITSTSGTINVAQGEHTINLEVIAVGGLASLKSDFGTASPVASNINILGGPNIGTTSLVANTITINLDADVVLPGVLELPYLGAGVVSTDATGLFSSSNGTDGQLMIGSTLGTPQWASITSPLGTVTITPDVNSLDLTVTGGTSSIPSAFMAIQESTANDILGTSDYYLGNSVALTTSYDVNGDFYPGDGAGTPASFTAAQTGKFYFYFQTYIYDNYLETTGGTSMWHVTLSLKATSRTLKFYTVSSHNFKTYGPDETFNTAGIIDMTIGDTINFVTNVYLQKRYPLTEWGPVVIPLTSIDILGDATIAKTYVYGYLVE